ncbi:MAG TPA: DUF2336 domain-containing protein [Stellaceae bacterium]
MATWTREIIADLIEQASWTARAKSLERIGTRFAEGALEEVEWHAVTDAFRIALYDAEPLVRRVLAESVKTASDLPRDVLLALAHDIAAVAAPVLEHSRLLSEDDLLPMVLNGSTANRFAIAGRRLISGRIADALAKFGERTVIQRLIANDGAAINEATLHRLLDQFPDQPAIAEAIGRRRLLPVSVGGRLCGAWLRRSAGERLFSDRTGSLG